MSSPQFEFTARLEVLAEADPQLPARIFGLISTCNQLPTSFESRLRGDGLLSIALTVDVERYPNAERLSLLCRRMPAVLEARLSLCGRNRLADQQPACPVDDREQLQAA